MASVKEPPPQKIDVGQGVKVLSASIFAVYMLGRIAIVVIFLVVISVAQMGQLYQPGRGQCTANVPGDGRPVKGKCPAVGQGRQTDRSTLKPSILASVKVNYWKFAVGQAVKTCRLLTCLLPKSTIFVVCGFLISEMISTAIHFRLRLIRFQYTVCRWRIDAVQREACSLTFMACSWDGSTAGTSCLYAADAKKK